jgi:hypothetical protein
LFGEHKVPKHESRISSGSVNHDFLEMISPQYYQYPYLLCDHPTILNCSQSKCCPWLAYANSLHLHIDGPMNGVFLAVYHMPEVMASSRDSSDGAIVGGGRELMEGRREDKAHAQC